MFYERQLPNGAVMLIVRRTLFPGKYVQSLVGHLRHVSVVYVPPCRIHLYFRMYRTLGCRTESRCGLLTLSSPPGWVQRGCVSYH